jgi:hypothetical protein
MLHDFTREFGVELPDDISASSGDITPHKTPRKKTNLVDYRKDSPIYKIPPKTLDLDIILDTFYNSLLSRKISSPVFRKPFKTDI